MVWAVGDSNDKTITIITNELEQTKSFSVSLTNPVGNSEVGLNGTITVDITALVDEKEDEVKSKRGGGAFGYFAILMCLILKKMYLKNRRMMCLANF